MRRSLLILKLAALPLLAAVVPGAAVLAQPPGWNDPFPPHRVMGNLYYVGTTQLSSFLITTDQGHILVSSNYEASVPVIQAGIEQLGFDFADIKILLSGHAHPDHIEGDALVKELTGAQVVVGRLEVPDVQAFKHPKGKTQPIDRIIDAGDTVTLGETTLTAHLQPGHTRGCVAWTLQLEEEGRTYDALIECSLNSQGLQYVGNETYPDIVDDVRSTFRNARDLPAEVWVSSHGVFYGLDEKYAKLQARKPGDPNPFYDPEGYQAHVAEFERRFEEVLARQLAE
jgi:metallo-beta-lactamase class B